MKKIIIIVIAVFLSVNSFGQNMSKADSIKQAEINKVVTEIVAKTSIYQFQEWLYKNITAEKFNEFLRYYNAFIEKEYVEKTKPQK